MGKGFNESQAEAIVDTAMEVAELSKYDVATKQDIALVKHDIASLKVATRQDIASIRHDMASLEIKISESKADILKYMLTGFVALAGLMITLIKFGH